MSHVPFFGYMLDAIYDCAKNPSVFVAEVRGTHKLLKKWDVGERLLWIKLKVVIGWAKGAIWCCLVLVGTSTNMLIMWCEGNDFYVGNFAEKGEVEPVEAGQVGLEHLV